jgi:hypothetical protein
MQRYRYEPIIPGVTTRMVVTAAEVINTTWIFCIGMTYILVYIKTIDEYHLPPYPPHKWYPDKRLDSVLCDVYHIGFEI